MLLIRMNNRYAAERVKVLRHPWALDAHLNHLGLLCLVGCSSSSSQAIFDTVLVLLTLFTIPAVSDRCRRKKNDPPLQPVAVCCSSAGCYLSPALQQQLGAMSTQRSLPRATYSQTPRQEKTVRCSHLVCEAEEKLRDEPESTVSWGERAHASLCRGNRCAGGECSREIGAGAGLQVSGLLSRAPLPPKGWEAGPEAHLDGSAGSLHSTIKGKTMGRVRLTKHL